MKKKFGLMRNASHDSKDTNQNLTLQGRKQVAIAADEIMPKALMCDGELTIHHSLDKRSKNTAEFLKKCMIKKGFNAVKIDLMPELHQMHLTDLEDLIEKKIIQKGFHVVISHRNKFGIDLSDGQISMIEIPLKVAA